MIIPRGALPKNQERFLDQDKKKKKKKKPKSKKKKKDHFDKLLDDLESYEEGCETRSLMDST
jgi:hypothetical protein